MVNEGISSSTLYSPYSCLETPAQDALHALVPKSMAALSIMGSSHILTLVCMKWRENKSSIDPYQRTMAMYSVYDILYSFFVWFMGTWMVPSETGWFGAAGNTATCAVQGLFNTPMLFGLAMYQMMLSLQMTLLVTYEWTSTRFERRLEHKMHIFIISVTFLMALVPLFFQGYDPFCGLCFVAPLPTWCGDWYLGDGKTECVRGNEIISNIYVIILILSNVIATLFCTGAMYQIYLCVHRQDQRQARYSFNRQSRENFAESKRIRKIMLLYTSSFYICWLLPGAIWYLIPSPPPSLLILGDMLIPLMGFFNMLVFFLPKCIKYQQLNPDTSLAKCYLLIVFKFEIGLASILRQKFKQKFNQNNDVEEQNDAVDQQFKQKLKQNNDVEEQNNAVDVNNVNNGIDVKDGILSCCPEVAASVELPPDIEMISAGHDAASAPIDEPTGDSRRRGSFMARIRRTSITRLIEFDPIDIDDGIGFQRYNEHRGSCQDRDAISLDGMDHEARDEPVRRQSFVARLRRTSLRAMLGMADIDASISLRGTDEDYSPQDGAMGKARDAPGRALLGPAGLDDPIRYGATNKDCFDDSNNKDRSSPSADRVRSEGKDDIPPKRSDGDQLDDVCRGDKPGRERERKDASPTEFIRIEI